MSKQQQNWPCSHASCLLPRKMSPLSEVTAEFSQREIHQKKSFSTKSWAENYFVKGKKLHLRKICLPFSWDLNVVQKLWMEKGSVHPIWLSAPFSRISPLVPTTATRSWRLLVAHESFLWYFTAKSEAGLSISPFNLAGSTLLVSRDLGWWESPLE